MKTFKSMKLKQLQNKIDLNWIKLDYYYYKYAYDYNNIHAPEYAWRLKAIMAGYAIVFREQNGRKYR